MFANMMIPSEVKTDFPEGESSKMYSSTVDALTQGTKNGLEIFLSVIAMLIVVMALVFLVNSILDVFPDINGSPITIERVLGLIFAPLAWFMGIPWEESLIAGQLLGFNKALNEFVAYIYLSDSEK